MAQRRKGGQRIEPTFGSGLGALVDVRPSTRDRVAAPGGGRKKAATSGKPPAADSRPAPRRRGKGRRGAKAQRRSGSWLARTLRRGVYWGAVLGIWGVILAVGILGYYAAHLPPTSEWQVPARPPNVKIVSASGQLLANRGDTGGEAVRLEQLPPYLPEAVIAIEDRRFRSHFGFDPFGLVRAVAVNLTAGTLVQGGSTITQQLAKNLFLEPDRTLKRKMQEVVLALWLETEFSKDEILEMYLNRVYLGSGAYGVDAAARRYFGKSARLVTLSEAATLAGLLKAPSRYAPTRNPDLAEARAQLVLAAMHEAGFIDADAAKTAIAAPAQVVGDHNAASENYVADWVMDLLPHFVGSFDTDIIVDTTIDIVMQDAAEAALRKAIDAQGAALGVSQGAVVTLDTAGAVKALVGGRDYRASQYNRAVYARRQPGSAFKPFVYLAALESGLTPQSVRIDEPISIKGWSPQNYTRKYHGPVTLTEALSLSLNTVAAGLTQEVGPKTVARTAKRLGITSPLSANPSLALGTSEVTPLEIAAAYVPFSNGGYGVLPHVVRRIRTVDGRTLYARQGDGPGKVVDSATVGRMNLMMVETLRTGTGRKALLDDRPAGGKTGTSQEFRDAWFIGYTGNLTTAVWLGNDDNSPTRRATGGSLPAEVWRETMQAAHVGQPVAGLPGVADSLLLAADPAPAGGPIPPADVGGDAGADGRPILPAPGGGGPLDLLGRLFGG
ncbi:transglycosylase domain-containing protein [Polymorphum gilvum]|uniref:Putative penicillin-binding transpeptidase/transglycosylase protein n=1 Tax=Polymorphum gilvum (strain LMG 25793 / CGMCC 1.9160 / SL003B-26A1) TaxID=991905 RepID=F2IYF5_POLGS|nr:PBP1A family penicillin-binding protein [Polymorphum gilvum]ADZ68468.1 Putative penicillin-binding transpeptidase/transglycosylase protein [Polymorphum gilvum SL003B-26A1]